MVITLAIVMNVLSTKYLINEITKLPCYQTSYFLLLHHYYPNRHPNYKVMSGKKQLG